MQHFSSFLSFLCDFFAHFHVSAFAASLLFMHLSLLFSLAGFVFALLIHTSVVFLLDVSMHFEFASFLGCCSETALVSHYTNESEANI